MGYVSLCVCKILILDVVFAVPGLNMPVAVEDIFKDGVKFSGVFPSQLDIQRLQRAGVAMPTNALRIQIQKLNDVQSNACDIGEKLRSGILEKPNQKDVGGQIVSPAPKKTVKASKDGTTKPNQNAVDGQISHKEAMKTQSNQDASLTMMQSQVCSTQVAVDADDAATQLSESEWAQMVNSLPAVNFSF